MAVKLIAIDLDGTLLNSKTAVSEENLRAIKAAREKNVMTVICTGRCMQEAMDFAEHTGAGKYCIASNGAIIKDSSRDITVYSNEIPIAQAFELLSIVEKYPLFFMVYSGDRPTCEINRYKDYRGDLRNEYIDGIRKRINIVRSIRQYLGKHESNIQKIYLLSHNPILLLKVRNDLKAVDYITITSSWSSNLEINNKGANKGVALKHLCGILGIGADEVMAIGDSENDIQILEFAGVSVAMGNATDTVKKSARHVTLTNDQNGVAHAINQFVL